MGSLVNWYDPSLSVARLRASLVLVFVNVTFAFGTTAPVASETVPERFAVTSAACAEKTNNRTASTKPPTLRLDASSVRFMKDPRLKFPNRHVMPLDTGCDIDTVM